MAPTELSATAPLKRLAPRLGFRAATMRGSRRRWCRRSGSTTDEVDRRVRLLKGSSTAPREPTSSSWSTAHAASTFTSISATARPTPRAGCCTSPAPPATSHRARPTSCPTRASVRVTRAAAPVGCRYSSATMWSTTGSRPTVRSPSTARGQPPTPPGGDSRTSLPPETSPSSGSGLGGARGAADRRAAARREAGLHLAFGRSDHFGGAVGPGDFSRPEAVIHQDHVFLPELQPRIVAARVELVMEDGARLELMRDGIYSIRFDGES